LILIYQAENQIDAQLALDCLLANGFEAIIKGSYLSGAVGELAATGLVAVWLLDATKEDDAKKIIVQFESHKQFEPLARECSGCGETIEGNFEICWNCGAELPVTTKAF